MSQPVFVHMYALKNIVPLSAEVEMGHSFCGGLEDIGFYTDQWFLFFHQSGTGAAYYEKSEMKRSAQVAFERFSILDHRRHFSALVQSILAEIGEYIELVASKDIARETSEVLLSLLEQGWNLEARAFTLYNATQPQNSSLIEAAIKSELAGVTKSEEQAGEALAILTTPDHLSKIAQKELDLIELAVYIQEHKDEYRALAKAGSGLRQKVDEHLQKYGTLMLGEGSWCPQVDDDLYKSIDALLNFDTGELQKRSSKLRNYSKTTVESKCSLARELGLSDETLNLCDAAAFIGETRLSLRIDGWVPLIFAEVQVSRELESRKELTGPELMFQTRSELLSLFRGKPLVSLEDLSARAGSDTYLMMVRDRSLHFYYGDEARQLFAAMVPTKELDKAATIRGAPAMKGKVVGRVLVYGWGEDMEVALRQMTPDTILVAGQARPKLMPLVRQARGMVTDEGGIMGHAAVVARELRIPCIVGAKIATQRLKTGDLIELDATVGLVRILAQQGD
jgi:phosphohistidine swiveling domain-containing protein